jgi:hypothetical protein
MENEELILKIKYELERIQDIKSNMKHLKFLLDKHNTQLRIYHKTILIRK